MTWPEFTFRLLGFVKAAAEIARQSAFEQRSFLMSLRPGGVADQRLRCRVLRFCGSSPKAEGAGGAEAHPQDAVLPVGERAWGSLFFPSGRTTESWACTWSLQAVGCSLCSPAFARYKLNARSQALKFLKPESFPSRRLGLPVDSQGLRDLEAALGTGSSCEHPFHP